MTYPLAGSGSTAHFTRRRFLEVAGATAALSSTAWARGFRAPASDRITIGVIGWGMMGPANTKAFLAQDDCQVVAACDIERTTCRPPSTPSTARTATRTARPTTTTARCSPATISTPS